MARPRSAAATAAIANLQLTSANRWSVRWGRVTGLPSELRGGRYRTGITSPEAAAGLFLASHRAALGLTSATTIKAVRTQSLPGASKVTFEQVIDGIPVLDALIGVVVTEQGEIVHVSSTACELDGPIPSPRMNAQGALEYAVGETGLPLLHLDCEPRHVIVVEDVPRPAFEFYLACDAGYAEPWRVVIDAESGETIFAYPLVQHATGSGRVFDPNPVCTMADVSLRDRGDSNSAVPTAAYFIRPLERLDPPVGGVYHLRGQFAKMENREIPTNVPPTSTTGVFEYWRWDDAFEEVMAYYTVDRSQAYIQSLGFSNVNNRPQEVDAHGRFGQDNSVYVASPLGAGYLSFGDGGVDDAEDADIILHEYGHAIQDNSAPGVYMGVTNNGYGNETRAMGEGFSDYWAAASGLEASLASNFPAAWVGEWDAKGYASGVKQYLRRVDTEKVYPTDMVGQIHTDGEIWSSILWTMLETIGKEATNRTALLSHFLVPTNPDFEDGANALMAANAILYPTEASSGGPIVGSHFNTLCSILSARGIITCSLICNCSAHGDTYGDGGLNVVDISVLINEVFFSGLAADVDPLCPHVSRADYNCDLLINVLDISHAVDYVLRGGAGPCDPCSR